MFESVDIASAAQRRWDVIVAGSSFSAMFFLLGLPRDASVLIVEKGGIVPWIEQIQARNRPRTHYAMENLSGHEKSWTAHTLFGGNSNCWWGQTPRFHPDDFALATRYGVGEDWPLDYDDLEPFYTEVEAVMEIAGGGSEHILPRSAPFPFPPHTLSRSDQRLVAERPDIWVPVPTARSNGGSRATCCTTGVCDVCPVEAKFTIMNGVERFSRPGAFLLTDTAVKDVLVAGGTATGAIVSNGERDVEIAADVIALGANAIGNAEILMRSGLGGPVVGQYLHEQLGHVVDVDVGVDNYFGGSSITLHGYGAYTGAHRARAAAVLIENYNAPAHLRTDRGRWTQRLHLKLIAEDLPEARNRVTLKDNAAQVEWHGHSDYAKRGIARAIAMLPELLTFPIERVHPSVETASEAHIQGTHRMGEDPATSVVDRDLRLHDVANVLALGAGVFPTCSPANPTLTLSALALRAGRRLA